MKLNHLFFICPLIFAFLTSCKEEEQAPVNQSTPRPALGVEGFLLQPGMFEKDYIASGNILPNESVSIVSEISGRVTGIFFKEGSRVQKGQVLLTLYDADIHAEINKLKAHRSLQIKIWDRQQELLGIGGISQQDFETTETQITAIDADIAAQEALLRKTKIIAPFDGMIGIRNISEGAIVAPGMEITMLQQLDPLKMDFMIPEQYHSKIQTGQSVYFTLTSDTLEYKGVIRASDPGAGNTTRSLRVRATVPNADRKIIPGSFATVRIPFESNKDALLIPSQCVIPTTRDKKVVRVKNGKAEMVVVKLGMRTQDMVEVTTGVAPGDTLITTGLMQVKPGMPVQITKLSS